MICRSFIATIKGFRGNILISQLRDDPPLLKWVSAAAASVGRRKAACGRLRNQHLRECIAGLSKQFLLPF